MKIITEILFLTFVGALYVKSADARVPTGVRYVVVKFTNHVRYRGFIKLVPPKQHLGNPHSLRPLWMSLDIVQVPFKKYYIYMEMSHQRRYTTEALSIAYGNPDNHQPGRDLPESALVLFSDHKYEATNFVEYNALHPHTNVSDNDTGGRIYLQIKDTGYIYYATLVYMGRSSDWIPDFPAIPDGYFTIH